MLKDEYGPNYCRKDGVYTNGGASAVQIQPGTLFTGGDTPVPFVTGAPLAVTGICLTTSLVQPGASVPVAWIYQGPAIVNDNEIDYPADAPETATIKTAIDAMNIKRVSGLDGL